MIIDFTHLLVNKKDGRKCLVSNSQQRKPALLSIVNNHGMSTADNVTNVSKDKCTRRKHSYVKHITVSKTLLEHYLLHSQQNWIKYDCRQYSQLVQNLRAAKKLCEQNRISLTSQ